MFPLQELKLYYCFIKTPCTSILDLYGAFVLYSDMCSGIYKPCIAAEPFHIQQDKEKASLYFKTCRLLNYSVLFALSRSIVSSMARFTKPFRLSPLRSA